MVEILSANANNGDGNLPQSSRFYKLYTVWTRYEKYRFHSYGEYYTTECFINSVPKLILTSSSSQVWAVCWISFESWLRQDYTRIKWINSNLLLKSQFCPRITLAMFIGSSFSLLFKLHKRCRNLWPSKEKRRTPISEWQSSLCPIVKRMVVS